MRSDVRLEALMFQLTPTRTRCELVLALDGEREKIGSGMLEPFMAHLKTVNDLVMKGGYSVVLQPPPEADDGALWFTKATVQRFVRFVSTPEILERIINIKCEIEQIDEAVAIQENQPILEQSRSSEYIEGSRHTKSYGVAERAIIIYKPEDQQSESSGSTLENSRVQLLRTLENRKFALQKEQGMAFARASVSGFTLDHMTDLISFAECFGGSRLLTACVKYMDLCRVKHDTGEWLEIEPTEEMSIQMKSDLSSMNGADMFSPGDNPHMPPGHFQHPIFPQWPMQPPPGGAGFQPYPMQGPPYYQNYPGSGPYFQPPPYSPMEGDPRFNYQRSSSSTKSQDEKDQEEVSEDQGSRRKAGGSSKKKRSGTVVIRNINFIESKSCNAHGSESESDSLSENAKDSKGLREDTSERRKNKSYDGGKELVSDNWQAFQNFLLRDEDESGKSADHGMFSGEKVPHVRRKNNNIDLNEILPAGQDSGDFLARRLMNFDKDSGRRLVRKNTADNDLSYSNEGRMSRESRLDEKIQEMEVGGQRYTQGVRASSDDIMIYEQNRFSSLGAMDSHSENAYKLFSGNLNRDSQLPNITDESFIVYGSQVPQGERDSRTIIDIDTEFRPILTEDSRIINRNQVNYEPDGLSLIPTREAEGDSLGYDPAAIENDLVAGVPGNVLLDNAMKYHIATSAKQGPKKTEKEKKTRNLQDGLNRRKTEPLRWGKQAQLNPQAEARVRADKLRAYKADLQKEKKLKEEQEVKRLEALKRERQKRIVARGQSSTAQPLSTPPNRARLSAKPSSGSFNSSKFSDSAPGSSSSFPKFPLRASSGSNDSQKITKTSSRLYGSSRSVSSLPDTKKKDNSITSEKKPVSRLRRLSDPRGGGVYLFSSVKSASSDQVVSKQKISETKMKKISAIINQDKSKSATLPELKVRKSTGTERVSSAKKGNGDKITVVSEKLKTKRTVQNRQQHRSNEDDTPIIEKTVVTEGQKRLSVPILASSESYNGHSTDVVSEYAQIHVPSTINTNELEKIADEIPSDKQSTHEATIDCVKDGSQVTPSSVASEKPYEAPHARVSSIEDSSTITVSHSEAPPQVKISEIFKSDCEVVPQTHLSGSCQSISVEPETTENTHVKGFKKLLKFGRKSHSSPCDASKSSSIDSHHAGAALSPSEGTTLKILISEDDSHTGSHSKGTRSFKFLTPFCKKSSEKRTAF